MSQITITGAAYGRGKDEDIADGLRYSSSGTAFINFKVAAYGGKDKDKVYWTCVAFNELAEHIAASCANGTRLIVSGRIESNNWEGDDGKKRYDTQILVNEAGIDLRYGTASSHAPTRSEGQRNTAPKPKAGVWGNTPEEDPF